MGQRIFERRKDVLVSFRVPEFFGVDAVQIDAELAEKGLNLRAPGREGLRANDGGTAATAHLDVVHLLLEVF